ncbi:MAG: hypothetical protein ACKO6F_06840 [Cyanobium sp.]
MALPRHRRQARRPAAEPQTQHRLVSLWADLLSDLQQGAPGVATSAEEMADELPGHLVSPVNRELEERGCSFRVKPLRKAATPPPACSPAREAPAAVLHRCD